MSNLLLINFQFKYEYNFKILKFEHYICINSRSICCIVSKCCCLFCLYKLITNNLNKSSNNGKNNESKGKIDFIYTS